MSLLTTSDVIAHAIQTGTWNYKLINESQFLAARHVKQVGQSIVYCFAPAILSVCNPKSPGKVRGFYVSRGNTNTLK